MIDEKMAKVEIRTGLSAVCAWCEHYHNGKREGKVCCGIAGCGSEEGFVKYKGPMDGSLPSFCFICGRNSESMIKIKGRMIGVCHRMGPEKRTCFDNFKLIVQNARQGIVVNEVVIAPGKNDDTER